MNNTLENRFTFKNPEYSFTTNMTSCCPTKKNDIIPSTELINRHINNQNKYQYGKNNRDSMTP